MNIIEVWQGEVLSSYLLRLIETCDKKLSHILYTYVSNSIYYYLCTTAVIRIPIIRN